MTPLPTVTGLSSLGWRTKLSDILSSDWELSDPWASQKANLIDILSHVSGMPRYVQTLLDPRRPRPSQEAKRLVPNQQPRLVLQAE